MTRGTLYDGVRWIGRRLDHLLPASRADGQAGEMRPPVVASLESQRLVGFLSSYGLIRARLLVHEEEGSGPSMADLG